MTDINVEIVFALPEKQRLFALCLPERSSIADAIASSPLAREFPGHDFAAGSAGIWGQPLSQDHVLADGDRVEIYRPLCLDPREARRQLALIGRTMGNSGHD